MDVPHLTKIRGKYYVSLTNLLHRLREDLPSIVKTLPVRIVEVGRDGRQEGVGILQEFRSVRSGWIAELRSPFDGYIYMMYADNQRAVSTGRKVMGITLHKSEIVIKVS